METVTEKTTIKNGGKPKDDPHIQLMKLRFWARFLISLLAFGLFGWLVFTMVNKPDELAQSSKDLINLAFGAFLPIIGMLGKHWFETAHDEPEHNPEPDKPKEEEANGSIVTP